MLFTFLKKTCSCHNFYAAMSLFRGGFVILSLLGKINHVQVTAVLILHSINKVELTIELN